MNDAVRDLKKALEAEGYVVVKAETYRRLQERVRRANDRADWADEMAASNARWAENAITEERRLANRLTFVYGQARAAGCTTEQLTDPEWIKPRIELFQ